MLKARILIVALFATQLLTAESTEHARVAEETENPSQQTSQPQVPAVFSQPSNPVDENPLVDTFKESEIQPDTLENIERAFRDRESLTPKQVNEIVDALRKTDPEFTREQADQLKASVKQNLVKVPPAEVGPKLSEAARLAREREGAKPSSPKGPTATQANTPPANTVGKTPSNSFDPGFFGGGKEGASNPQLQGLQDEVADLKSQLDKKERGQEKNSDALNPLDLLAAAKGLFGEKDEDEKGSGNNNLGPFPPPQSDKQSNSPPPERDKNEDPIIEDLIKEAQDRKSQASTTPSTSSSKSSDSENTKKEEDKKDSFGNSGEDKSKKTAQEKTEEEVPAEDPSSALDKMLGNNQPEAPPAPPPEISGLPPIAQGGSGSGQPMGGPPSLPPMPPTGTAPAAVSSGSSMPSGSVFEGNVFGVGNDPANGMPPQVFNYKRDVEYGPGGGTYATAENESSDTSQDAMSSQKGRGTATVVVDQLAKAESEEGSFIVKTYAGHLFETTCDQPEADRVAWCEEIHRRRRSLGVTDAPKIQSAYF